MEELNNIKLIRINVNLEQSVKEWYQYKARTMGMSMSQLMSYILTNYHDSQVQAQNLADIKNIAYDEKLKNDNKEMYAMLIELINATKEGENN